MNIFNFLLHTCVYLIKISITHIKLIQYFEWKNKNKIDTNIVN